ncbi:MAG: hypothetical protein N2316_12345, partial [Spirochaetes bacterium]|nr:hypothetical protein [Spirochaetota bacterium]
MRRIFYAYVMGNVLAAVLCVGCSKADIDYFQINDALPSYELFSLLDDYPSLKEPFSNLDPVEFNQRMSEPINENVSLAKEILAVTVTLLEHPQHPITDSLSALRNILQRIIEQDMRDDPDETYANYANDFFDFLDDLSATDPNVGNEIIRILRKNVEYLRNAYDATEIEDVMSDLVAFLRETDGQTLQSVLPLLQEGLAKLLMIANQDYSGTVPLCNAVRGVDALLSGINDIATGDAQARELLYDIIRSGGDIFTATASNKDFATISQELLRNLEDYATSGGGVYDKDSSYNNDTTGVGTGYYVNTELRNGIKTMWPSLVSLFIRGKEYAQYCPIKDAAGRSVIECLTEALYTLKEHCAIDFSDFSKFQVEPSLKRMVEYN